jgi:hypothetical protein
MARKYSKSFTMQGDAEDLFDTAATQLSSLGFTVLSSERPRLIVGKRGKMLGSCRSFKVTEWATRLSVHFAPAGDGVKVTCEYEIYLPLSGIMTARDVSIIDDEMEGFRQVLAKSRVPAISPHAVRRPPESTATPDADPPPYLAELEQLARLRDRHVITEEEFNRKKIQLLAIQ